MRAFGLLGFALVGSGCSTGAGTVIGPIRGKTFAVGEELSAVVSDGLMRILLTTAPDVCAQLSAGRAVKNVQALEIVLFQNVTAPGTFPVVFPSDHGGCVGTCPTYPPLGSATVGYDETDANCITTIEAVGLGGTITVTSVNQGAYTGSGKVDFGDDLPVTFEFTTTACPALADSSDAVNCR